MRYVFADCELDTHLCAVRRGATRYPLRPKPLQVLRYLLEHCDRVVSKQELAEQLWPDQAISDTVIENSILAARRAVGDSGRAQRIIQTLHGHGYRCIVLVTVASDTVAALPTAAGDAVENAPSSPTMAVTDAAPVQSTAPSPALDASRRHLTVLFCDLLGSTALSQQLDPEEYMEIIRAYHTACAAVIERFAGHIAQYLGDGLLVYFGYPQAHEDDAQRAVHTALGMLDALRELNHHLQQTHEVQVAVRLGIHTGLVVVSAVGTGAQVAPLALGETPNIAARLQDLAAPNTVVLSAATYRLVQGYFVCHALGAQVLRHLAEPLEVYHVLRASALPHRFAVAVTQGLTPFVSRERERTSLADLWAQVEGGHGQVVGIVGEAGQGKSRLLYEFRQRLAGTPLTYVEGRCLSYGSTTPYRPLMDVVRQYCGITDTDAHETAYAKVCEALDAVGLDAEAAAPSLCWLLGVKVGPDALAVLTPEAITTRMCATLTQLWRHASHHRTAALCH